MARTQSVLRSQRECACKCKIKFSTSDKFFKKISSTETFFGNSLESWQKIGVYATKKKWYFPSRIVLTKCVENFSKCNLKIFYGIKIEKMEAKVLFEVEAVGRDLGMVRGLHFFNRDTIENFQITRGKIFQTLSQTISGGECFFEFYGFFV